MTALQKAARQLIARYDTLKDAEKATGISASLLSLLSNGKRKSASPWVLEKLGFEKTPALLRRIKPDKDCAA